MVRTEVRDPDFGGSDTAPPADPAEKGLVRSRAKGFADLKAIRAAAPSCAVLICHDEHLLASMVQGIDGALVGFASR